MRKLPARQVDFTDGAPSFGDLRDVDLTGLADGQSAVWDQAAGLWKPGSPSGGDGGGGMPGAAPFVKAMRSGLWYESPISPSVASTVLAQGAAHYVPFYVPNSIIVSDVSIEVTTGAAGSSVPVGIYDDVGGYPANRLALFGTVDAATAGVKTITGLSLALTGGYYWLAVCSAVGAPTLRHYSTAGSPGAFLGATTPGLATPAHLGWSLTGVTSLDAVAPGTPSTANPNGNRTRVQVKVG